MRFPWLRRRLDGQTQRAASTPSGRIRDDDAIHGSAEDELGRGRLAGLIATEIETAPVRSGFVMAVTGPWGDGKTSLLNLVREKLAANTIVIDFNPWLFSDAEALVGRFFSELAAELEDEWPLEELAKSLLEYGVSLLPLLGPHGSVLAAGAKGGAKIIEGKAKRSELIAKKKRLEATLEAAGRRIVVMVDDIDRLQSEEIRDVVRLVKLVGDLPYMTYVLAFERKRVETALCDEGEGGRYLEKIVQLIHELPEIEPRALERLLIDGLNEVLEDCDTREIDKNRWEVLFATGIRPLFGNVRDVRRYLNSVPAALELLGTEIALEDLLALEALRTFEPQVHAGLAGAAPILTSEPSRSFFSSREERKTADREAGEKLVGRSIRDQEATKQILSLLFNAELFESTSASEPRTRNARRVSDGALLKTYLRMTLDESIVSAEVFETVRKGLSQPSLVEEMVKELSGEQLLDLLGRLTEEGDQLKVAGPTDLALLFLDQAPRLHTRRIGPLTLPSRLTLQQLIVNLVIHSDSPQTVARRLYEQAKSESDRSWILVWFGSFPERTNRTPERELFGEELTAELEADLAGRVIANPSAIATEISLENLLAIVHGQESDGLKHIAEDDNALRAILKRCLPLVEHLDSSGLRLGEHTEFNSELLALFDRNQLLRRVEEIERGGELSEEERPAAEAALRWLREYGSPPPAKG